MHVLQGLNCCTTWTETWAINSVKRGAETCNCCSSRGPQGTFWRRTTDAVEIKQVSAVTSCASYWNKCFNVNTSCLLYNTCCLILGFMVSKALAAEYGILHFELANIPVGNLEKDSVFAGNKLYNCMYFWIQMAKLCFHCYSVDFYPVWLLNLIQNWFRNWALWLWLLMNMDLVFASWKQDQTDCLILQVSLRTGFFMGDVVNWQSVKQNCTKPVFIGATVVVCTDEASLLVWDCSALRGSYVFTVLVKSAVVGWPRGPGLTVTV